MTTPQESRRADRRHRPPFVLALAALFGALLVSVPAAGQVGAGVRAGLSVAPATRIPDVTSQVYLGAHVETPPLAGRLVFRPNVEAGFLDGLVVVGINAEFVWKFAGHRSGWSAYAGGGPTIGVFRLSADRFGTRRTESAAGVDALVGIEHEGGLFFEVKLGALNRPDIAKTLLDVVEEVKVGFGYSWR